MKRMERKLSKRLNDIVLALPLYEGIRVLEIGCGPGAMAREIAKHVGSGYILAIDRSAKAIQQAIKSSQQELGTGKLSFKQIAVERFVPDSDTELFDIAVAIRVGAFDGRHPEIEKQSLKNIAKYLKNGGRFFIDGGDPIKEIKLDDYK